VLPFAPFAPVPALSVTRLRLTVDDAIHAATLEPPGAVALGDVNDRSSIVTPPDETPVTERAYPGEGEVTCALPPTYVQTGPDDPAAHDSPPKRLTGGAVTFTCSV
jgi:hypothetical protein